MKNKVLMVILFVSILMIFTLTSCKSYDPATECPPYIDLSLDREVSAFDKVADPVDRSAAWVSYNPSDFYPDDVYVIEYSRTSNKYDVFLSSELKGESYMWPDVDVKGDNRPTVNEFIYITDKNVLYLVLYQTQEIDGVVYRYVTKLAYREGDEFIYKADNWSGEGVMIAEYSGMYYEYFNVYKEHKGKPTTTPPTDLAETRVKLPDYIDLSTASRFEQMDAVLATDFDSAENPLELAHQFVPEGATVYEAVGKSGNAHGIKYVTADGVYYYVVYTPSSALGEREVSITARKATDNYSYTTRVDESGKVLNLEHTTNPTNARGSVEPLNQWRGERGLSIPVPPVDAVGKRIFKNV